MATGLHFRWQQGATGVLLVRPSRRPWSEHFSTFGRMPTFQHPGPIVENSSSHWLGGCLPASPGDFGESLVVHETHVGGLQTQSGFCRFGLPVALGRSTFRDWAGIPSLEIPDPFLKTPRPTGSGTASPHPRVPPGHAPFRALALASPAARRDPTSNAFLPILSL